MERLTVDQRRPLWSLLLEMLLPSTIIQGFFFAVCADWPVALSLKKPNSYLRHNLSRRPQSPQQDCSPHPAEATTTKTAQKKHKRVADVKSSKPAHDCQEDRLQKRIRTRPSSLPESNPSKHNVPSHGKSTCTRNPSSCNGGLG